MVDSNVEPVSCVEVRFRTNSPPPPEPVVVEIFEKVVVVDAASFHKTLIKIVASRKSAQNGWGVDESLYSPGGVSVYVHPQCDF